MPASVETMGDEHRVGLGEARQVVEVAVGPKGVVHVAVSIVERRRRKDEKPVAEPVQDLLTPAAANLGIGRHQMTLYSAVGEAAKRSMA